MPPGINTTTTTFLGNEYTTFTGSEVASANYANTDRINKVFWYGKEGNYGYPDFPLDRNVGHDMRITGYEWHKGICPAGNIWRGGANNMRYEGSFAVDTSTNGDTLSSGGSPASRAAEAFSRMKPTEPSFSGLNALYELKDVPRMLQQRFTPNLRNAANLHLAIQFGWLPLLRDVRNFVQTQRAAQKRLAQLLRDNGRPVRRSITLLDEMTDPVVTNGTAYGTFVPILVTQYYRREPTFRNFRYSRERWWASARFRYWLPGGPRDVEWTNAMLRKIYGLDVTPQVVYNAIPWSWLVDWFSNLGHIISNLDGGVADRLAADYFYIMRSREEYNRKDGFGFFQRKDGEKVNISGTAYNRAYSKWRMKGDPFGFNTSQISLSSMQLSILGALGISRL